MEINGVSGGGREKCVKRLTKRIITLFRLTPRLLGALRGKERGLSPIDFFFFLFFFSSSPLRRQPLTATGPPVHSRAPDGRLPVANSQGPSFRVVRYDVA